nr:POU domain, class 4, transcription factor 1 [Columba livia]
MMSMNSKQPHFAMHPTLPEHKYPSLHSSSEAIRRACLPTPPLQSNIFPSLDETLLARAEALAAVDIAVSQGKSHPFKPDATYHTMNSVPCTSTSTVPLAHHHHHHHHHHQALEPGDLLDHITSPSLSRNSLLRWERRATLRLAQGAAGSGSWCGDKQTPARVQQREPGQTLRRRHTAHAETAEVREGIKAYAHPSPG